MRCKIKANSYNLTLYTDTVLPGRAFSLHSRILLHEELFDEKDDVNSLQPVATTAYTLKKRILTKVKKQASFNLKSSGNDFTDFLYFPISMENSQF